MTKYHMTDARERYERLMKEQIRSARKVRNAAIICIVLIIAFSLI